MKKKTIIGICIVAFLALLTAITFICVKNSSWADEKSDEISFSVENGFKFYPDNDNNYASGEYLEWHAKEYNEFVIDATVEKGELVFRIYDMNGAEHKQEDKYILCEEHIIDETGVYTFAPENLQDGKKYYFCLDALDTKLDKADKYVVAEGIFKRNRYKTNWESLKGKIGIFGDE